MKVRDTGVIDENLISFKDLQTKYQLLLAENRLLKVEFDAFKARLSSTELQQQQEPCLSRKPENIIQQSTTESSSESISYRSASAEKIRLFMSLFKGRDDVYAKRWDSKKEKEFRVCGPFCCS
jgi:regulator of replication initiation timing